MLRSIQVVDVIVIVLVDMTVATRCAKGCWGASGDIAAREVVMSDEITRCLNILLGLVGLSRTEWC